MGYPKTRSMKNALHLINHSHGPYFAAAMVNIFKPRSFVTYFHGLSVDAAGNVYGGDFRNGVTSGFGFWEKSDQSCRSLVVRER